MVRCLLSFWTANDADLWVNQRLLVTRVASALPRIDKDTVRSVLEDLVDSHVLIRRDPSPSRTVYRLSSRFADPVAPGYAREIDELLVDPLPWVTPTGQFLRVGRLLPGRPRILPVATYPHFFTKHAWMRAWIRCLDAGLFPDPRRALEVAAEAAREAPLGVLAACWAHKDEEGPVGDAGRAFGTTRLWRDVRRWRREAGPPVSGADLPEAAIRLLHELCGHEHLAGLTGRPFLPKPRRILDEAFVYEELDRQVAAKLAPACPDTGSGPADMDTSSPDPLLPRLEPRIRAMEPALRDTLGDHRLAWPRGLFSLRTLGPSRPAPQNP